MGKRAKYKIVVGESGWQSEIWTVNINGNDIYLTTTGAKHTKISLHESGRGSWSIRSESVKDAPFVPKSGRHISLWTAPDVVWGDVSALYYLLFPDSELRSGRPHHDGEAGWIPRPGPTRAVQVTFALSPPIDAPIEKSQLNFTPPLSPLFVHQLTNRRVLLIAWRAIEVPDSLVQNMNAARAKAWSEALAQGLDPTGTKAGAHITDKHGVPGFIEVAPYNGIFG